MEVQLVRRMICQMIVFGWLGFIFCWLGFIAREIYSAAGYAYIA